VQKRAVEAGQQLLPVDAGGGEVEPDERITCADGRSLADVDVLDNAPSRCWITLTLPCGTTSAVATATWSSLAKFAQTSKLAIRAMIGQAATRQVGRG
jgi:hypothetical protein